MIQKGKKISTCNFFLLPLYDDMKQDNFYDHIIARSDIWGLGGSEPSNAYKNCLVNLTRYLTVTGISLATSR